METTNPQNLKYGIIYLYSDMSLSPSMHDPKTIVEKFVHPMQVEWINESGREDVLLIARRFNVGNIGKYATVRLTLSRMNRSGGWFEAIHRFADALMGVTDDGEGDIELNEYGFDDQYYRQSSVFGDACEAAPQDHTRVEKGPVGPRSRWRRIKEHLQELTQEAVVHEQQLPDEECRPNKSMYTQPARVEVDQIQEEESGEVAQLEHERRMALERIRRDIINYIAHYHDDPKELMSELLRGKVVLGQPGRVLVNGDLRIVLPEYDEMEIPMPAMCRTLYILFLKQRKQGGGIVLKNIDEYRDEIIEIYGMVKPGASEERVAQSVDNLCDPYGDSLNQMISRVNRCVRNVITDKDQARQYCIMGSRGKAYSVSLDAGIIDLPRAVTG